MPSQKKSGAILGYANILVKNLVNLIYVPLLLHYLGQGDYGVFQMTNSVVFALTLLSAGFYGSYVRFYMKERTLGGDDSGGIRRLNGMFLLVYVGVAVLCIIGGVLMVAFVHELFHNGLTPCEIALARMLLIIMSVNIAVTMISTPFDSYIIAHERFIFQKSRQLITSLFQPFIALVLLWIGAGAIGVACAQLFVSIILLFLNIAFAVRELNMSFSFTGLQWALFKAVAIFSFWILLNQIFDLVNNNVPNFLLGAMESASAVTVFSVAVQIRNIFFSMSTTMSGVFVPQINRIVAEEDDNSILTRLMTRVGRYQMIIFWFLFGGFIVLGRFFVCIWAGPANEDSYWLCLIMVFPIMIPLTQNTGIEIQRAKNRHKMRSLIYVLTAAIDIVVSILLIPEIGYWATAIGYDTSILLGTGLFMNWYYHNRIGIDMLYYWKKQIPIIAIAFLVVGVCLLGTWFIPVDSVAMLVAWGIVYTLLFGAGAMRFGLTSDERESTLNQIKRKVQR